MGGRRNERVMKSRPGIARAQQNPQFPQPQKDRLNHPYFWARFFFPPWFLGKHAFIPRADLGNPFLDSSKNSPLIIVNNT